MNCKYWDCGWCYAPENVEHNSKNGSCNEPEYCSYKKSQMTNQHTKITSTYPIDDEIVMINGVKYQRIVEEPKPQTLFEIIREWCDDDNQPTCEELVSRIEVEWLPKLQQEAGDTEVYYKNKGWNNCIKYLKERLRE